MSKYQYENVRATLGDESDNWLVFRIEDGTPRHTALCGTETIAEALVNLLNNGQRFHENIAAIATNFAGSNGLERAIDNNASGNGWIGIMQFIVGYAEVFNVQEAEPGMYDWYLAIDAYSEEIARHVILSGDMYIDDKELATLAQEAIRKHSYSEESSEPEDKLVQPHFECIENNNRNSMFSHFEIQTTREYYGTSGDDNYVEVVNEPIDDEDGEGGPIQYSVYGRFDPQKKQGFGGVQCLADFGTLEKAQEFVADLNGTQPEYIGLSENDVLLVGDEAIEKGGTAWFPVVDSVGCRLKDQKRWVAARRRI